MGMPSRTFRARTLVLLALLLLAEPASAAPFFAGIGDAIGGTTESRVTSISADGSTVVGQRIVTGSAAWKPYLWTSSTGMQAFSLSTFTLGAGSGVSGDGSFVVGRDTISSEAQRVQYDTAYLGLGDLPGGAFRSYSRGISHDGSVVVGSSFTSTSPVVEEAYRWTESGGMVGLGFLPGAPASGDSIAWAVSGDGTVVVGRSDSASGDEAFRWTSASGMVGLGDLPGGYFDSYAYDVTPDGSIVVGWGYPASNIPEAFMWTQASGMVGLGGLPNASYSTGRSVSADGSVVVGTAINMYGDFDAFIWTPSTGMQELDLVLAALGLDLTGWTLGSATVSDDGRMLAGNGVNPAGDDEAWVAELPADITLLDSDADGVPDAVDACPGFDDYDDVDEDHVPAGCDVCPIDNPDDADADGVCDSVDVCFGYDDMLDLDGDLVPDCDDLDLDGDGVDNCVDNCPHHANAPQADTDGNGIGDACDSCGSGVACATATFITLGGLLEPTIEPAFPFDQSFGRGISGDGSTAVGYAYAGPAGGSAVWASEAVSWTVGAAVEGLGFTPSSSYYRSGALGVSSNGDVVVGFTFNPDGDDTHAFHWDGTGGMVVLEDGVSAWFYTTGRDVSADGSVTVGRYETDPFNQYTAAIWDDQGVMTSLGFLDGGSERSKATGVSEDGALVAGASDGASGTEAFRWSIGTGMIGLGDLAGGSFSSSAEGISSDGSAIIGQSESASGPEAFRWTHACGMEGLGDLPGGTFDGRALGASENGQVVVGYSESSSGQEAMIWDATNGMRSLAAVLASKGVDLTGWTLFRADGVSDDGRVIVGTGLNPSGNNEAFRVEFGPYTGATPPGVPSLGPVGLLLLGGLIASTAVRIRRK